MTEAQWTPAFEGQRPPFQPGHELSTRHGIWSVRKVTPVVAELIAELEKIDPPWLDDVDRAAVEAWAHAEARCELLRSWLYARDEPVQPDGKPWAAEGLLLSWERRAGHARAALGMDPRSRAMLGRDTAVARAFARSSVDVVAEAGLAALSRRPS